MITRIFGDGGWAAGPAGNPPPLHVYDTDSEMANWYPPERPVLFPHPPGPVMIKIPQPGSGNELGDDPADPARQTIRRMPSAGMIGRFGVQAGAQL